MSESEKQLRFLESQIPALSGSAFAEARVRALASGQSVLHAENGVIYEVFPDGTRKVRKHIDAPLAVPKGKVVQLS